VFRRIQATPVRMDLTADQGVNERRGLPSGTSDSTGL
jgi:hypothetical protein